MEWSIIIYIKENLMDYTTGKNPNSRNGFKKESRVNVGRKRSKKTKLKMSIAKRNMTLQNRINIGLGHKGDKHWNWKGGISPINKRIRNSLEMKLWRKAVFERDKYTCVWCGQIGYKLSVDHIKPFALFPELRFAIDNGRTLCWECHRKTDTFSRQSQTKTLKIKTLKKI